MKKFVMAGIIILTIALSAAGILGALRKKSPITSVVGMYADSSGAYYIEVAKRQYFYYKLDRDGNVLTEVKLPWENNGYFCTYNEIVADDKGNVYVSTYEKDSSQYIRKRYVQMFDKKGRPIAKLFENSYEDMKETFEKIEEMDRLQILDGKVSIFETTSERTISLYEYDSSTGVESETEYVFESPVYIVESLKTKNGDLYYITNEGKLFYFNASNEIKQLNLNHVGGEKIVPFNMSLDNEGNLYFTDVYNISFIKYNVSKEKAEVIYNKTDYIGAGHMFEDLRFVLHYDGVLYAHSPIFENKASFLARLSDEAFTIEYKIYSARSTFLYITLNFLMIFSSLSCLLSLAYFTMRLRSLLVKQALLLTVLISIPPLFVSLRFFGTLKSQLTNQLNVELHSLAVAIAANIDGHEFRSKNFPEEVNGEYMKNIDSKIDIARKDFVYTNDEHMPENLYYVLFFVEDDAAFIAYGFDEISGMRDSYIMEHADIFFEDNHEYKPKNITGIDRYGSWIISRAFIFDEGEPVGLLEIGTSQNMIDEKIREITINNIIRALSITVCVTIILSVVFWRQLNGLKILKDGLRRMTDGDWHVRINVRTSDEIEDIANDFNKMSSKIEKYMDSLTKLNAAYEKFVPNELFEILDKSNIFEIKLGDQANKNINLMSLSIKNFYDVSKSMTTQECFETLNKVFGVSSQVIRRKGGVIESFGGFGLRALFTNETDYAIDAALNIIEKINGYNKENNKNIRLNITVQNGDSMVGIAGDYDRMVETVISKTINNIFILEKLTESYNINLLVTEKAFERIERKDKYNYCCIGRVNDEVESCSVQLYDFLDSYEPLKRTKRVSIKEDFEKGLAFYMEGDYSEAKKKFADVLRIDNTYDIAKMYLFMCDGNGVQEGTILL